jgi:hypothetical protein
MYIGSSVNSDLRSDAHHASRYPSNIKLQAAFSKYGHSEFIFSKYRKTSYRCFLTNTCTCVCRYLITYLYMWILRAWICGYTAKGNGFSNSEARMYLHFIEQNYSDSESLQYNLSPSAESPLGSTYIYVIKNTCTCVDIWKFPLETRKRSFGAASPRPSAEEQPLAREKRKELTGIYYHSEESLQRVRDGQARPRADARGSETPGRKEGPNSGGCVAYKRRTPTFGFLFTMKLVF